MQLRGSEIKLLAHKNELSLSIIELKIYLRASQGLLMAYNRIITDNSNLEVILCVKLLHRTCCEIGWRNCLFARQRSVFLK